MTSLEKMQALRERQKEKKERSGERWAARSLWQTFGISPLLLLPKVKKYYFSIFFVKNIFNPLNISKVCCIAILGDTLIFKRSLMSGLFKDIFFMSKG
jgi:hypothetical protein